MKITVEETRERRRPKKWLDVIECDMKTVGVCVNDVGNQIKWRLRTKEAHPK